MKAQRTDEIGVTLQCVDRFALRKLHDVDRRADLVRGFRVDGTLRAVGTGHHPQPSPAADGAARTVVVHRELPENLDGRLELDWRRAGTLLVENLDRPRGPVVAAAGILHHGPDGPAPIRAMAERLTS